MVSAYRAALAVAAFFAALFVAGFGAGPATASTLAHLSLDAESRKVFASHNPDRRVRPASLAKLMTATVVLDLVASRKLSLKQEVTVSTSAAGAEPVRVGLKPGKRYVLEELLQAAIVRSGNDAAVALAEAAAGTEEAFVKLMNAAARGLDMRNTRFANASGLPDPGAYTSARDMAKLVLHIRVAHARHASLFQAKSFKLGGRRVSGRNRWLNSYPGADGMKTGFTCRAGYHLAATATRDADTHVVVVLGATNTNARFQAARKLMDATWKSKVAGHDISHNVALTKVSASPPIIAKACLAPQLVDTSRHAPKGWAVKLKVFTKHKDALNESKQFIERFDKKASVYLIPRMSAGIAYQAGASGFSKRTATLACLRASKQQIYCELQPPVVAHLAWNRAQRLAKDLRKGKKRN